MTDPISGAAAMQNIQKMQQLSEAAPVGESKGPTGPSFAQVLEGKQAEAAQAAQPTQGPQAPDAAAPVSKTEGAQQIDRFVEGVLSDERQMNTMMERCMSGKTMSNSELLQMQGLVYGYAQKVELATKLVDKATGGLKQIMNTQV